MFKKQQYHFTGKVWKYNIQAGWYFVNLPVTISNEIRNAYKSEESGWGRLKINARIGDFEWPTSIWFDTKENTYLLPLNAKVRNKENVILHTLIQVTILI